MAAALFAGACSAKSAPGPFALAPGTRVLVRVTVTERLSPVESARRADVSLQGAADADGHLALEVARARVEILPAGAEMVVADTEVVAAAAGQGAAETREVVPLLEALRGAPVSLRLDPVRGLVAVAGIDAALARAVERDPALGAARDELSSLCSDAVWLRDLVAAGFTEVPRAVAEGGSFERRATVRVPGRGDASILLAGAAGRDTSGLPAVRSEGRLTAGAAFSGEPGVPPPEGVGPVSVAEVEGRATTSFTAGTSLPAIGEWTLTTPYAGGMSVTSTTRFTLVLR